MATASSAPVTSTTPRALWTCDESPIVVTLMISCFANLRRNLRTGPSQLLVASIAGPCDRALAPRLISLRSRSCAACYVLSRTAKCWAVSFFLLLMNTRTHTKSRATAASAAKEAKIDVKSKQSPYLLCVCTRSRRTEKYFNQRNFLFSLINLSDCLRAIIGFLRNILLLGEFRKLVGLWHA